MLTPSYIRALRHRFARLVYRVADPVLDDAVEFQDDTQDRRTAASVQERICHSLSTVFREAAARSNSENVRINLLLAKDTSTKVAEFLRANPVSSVYLSESTNSDERLAVHAGNVFYLSILLALALCDYVAGERKRLTIAELQTRQLHDFVPLGLAAMFADVAMAPLGTLYDVKRPLTQAERQLVLDHPTAGANALPEQFPATVRTVVKTHHERCDGTGYPKQMAGDRLHIFARILRIADAFDTATSGHTFDEARSPIRALWEMSVGPYRRFYDPVLREMLPKIVQPFPIGAKLRLVDGRFAVVVKHQREWPFDPLVVVAFDAKNRRIEQTEVPISVHDAGLAIKSLGGEDLTYLHVSDCADTPALTEFRTMFDASYP